jgi:hypothetical protein
MQMSSRLGWAVTLALLALLGPGAFAAEDKVVPAQEEPHHRPKFQNDYVRVLDVEIAQDDATLFHTHSLDYPYVMVTGVTLLNQLPGGQPGEVKIERGLIGYYRASQGAYTHRFTNLGPGAFRAIGIELLRSAAAGNAVVTPLPDATGYRTVLDNDRVRGYLLRLEPGQSAGPVTLAGPGIRVVLGGGELTQTAGSNAATLKLEPGQFAWRDQPETLTLKNTGSASLELVEFELK